MSELVTTEFALFLYAVRFGIGMAFIYDLLRIFRKVVGHNRWAEAFEDLLYCLWAGLQIYLMLFEYHNGDLRFYMILGACLGILLYTVSIGNIFVYYSAKLLNRTKDTACKAAQKAGKRAGGVLEKPKKAAASRIYAFRELWKRKCRHLYRYCKKKLTIFLKMLRILLCKS